MKIKIHKGFRGLLSLLVTLMLLVGVVPLQAWQGTKADAAVVCTVYFARDMGSANLDGSGTWIYAEKDSNIIANYLKMVSVSDGSGFEIYKWEFNEQPTKIFFTSNYKNTNDITGDNIKNNYLYYTKEWKNEKAVVDSFPYSELTYTVLQSSQFSSAMNADVNVLTSGAFTKQADRHYVNATLFDYFSDYELQNGTPRTTISEMYNSWEDPYRRMPLLTFDKVLSEYYRGVNETHPLYFGDIHREWGGYDFSVYNANQWSLYKTGSDYKQLYHDNNSMRRKWIDETSKAISDAAARGLYSNSLGTAYDEDEPNTTNAQRLKLASGNDAKWFNNAWLSGSNSTTKRLGASYDVEFPFWVEKHQRTFSGTSAKSNGTWAECNYFHINSEDPDHALRIRKDTNDKYYLEETRQGIYNFSGNDYYVQKGEASTLTTTYGFFPFNSKSDFYTGGTISDSGQNGDKNHDLGGLMDYRLRFDRTDYCFGMYMVIPFELNSMGTLYGTENKEIDAPITFSFSGDDDLLVYVDGTLVLDIGGNHGKVQGEINFYEKKSWVSQFKAEQHTDKNYLSTGETAPSGTLEKDKVLGYFRRSATITNNLTQFTGCDNVFGHSSQGMTDLSNMTGVGGNKICSAGEHVMEIFYVERGLFDSNMQIMYNLPVVEDRSFTVDQNITYPTVDSVFTDSANYTNNLNKIKIGTNVQFSLPTDTGNFSTLLGSQTYHGDHPNKYTFDSNNLYHQTFGTAITGSGSVANTYTAPMGNNQTLTYVNDFIKPYNYNLKVSEGNIFIGTDDTGQAVDYLFTTNWTLAKLSGTPQSPVPNAGPATDSNTTSGSSRPKRATKTTSTSATNNSNGFDFRGTQANPDEIVFENTMNTYTLTVTKEFVRADGDTAAHEFEVTVVFNNVGGLNLEEVDPLATISGDGTTITKVLTFTFESGTGTQTDTKTIVVPANTEYTVEETNPDGYTPSVEKTNNVVTVTNRKDNTPPDEPEPASIVLKIQKVWGTTSVYPDNVQFKVERKSSEINSQWVPVGSDSTGVAVMGMHGESVDYNSETGMLTLKSANLTQIGGRNAWVAYIFDSNNTSDCSYRITEYYDGSALPNKGEFTFGDTKFQVDYNVSTLPQTTDVTYSSGGISEILDFVGDYIPPGGDLDSSVGIALESYGEEDNEGNMNVRVLPLAVMNSVKQNGPGADTNTGGRGGYVPIAGGFIAILLAGAGYFIYKKRIFA